jgi:geranylgeranyl pyrophosphate synthase
MSAPAQGFDPRTQADALASLRDRIEDALARHLPAGAALSPRLLEAMRYSTLAGGKRIRPLLVLAACSAGGGDASHAIVPACALEYVHTYSLIHDDLPAMDNDVLRRGKPTCHVAFDEATAILAGCGLLTHALQLLAASPGCDDATRLAMLATLTEASGPRGMLAGQAFDLASTGSNLDLPALEALHAAKTGALIRAAVRIGGLCAGADEATLARLDDYARDIGLGFQVADDLLNVGGDAARLGKSVGSDAALGKNTYPGLLGTDAARAQLEALHQRALDALTDLGPAADLLRAIAHTLRDRDH